MNLAHLTADEFPFLVAIALVAAGAGFALGARYLMRAIARRRG